MVHLYQANTTPGEDDAYRRGCDAERDDVAFWLDKRAIEAQTRNAPVAADAFRFAAEQVRAGSHRG